MFRVTRYPMISKTESGRVSNEIPGSGAGSGTRWALVSVEINSTITVTCLSWAQTFSTNPDIHQPRQNLMFRQIYRSIKNKPTV